MATYEAGDYVKIDIADEARGESEWLWIRVARCDCANRTVFGMLDNQPLVFADELKLGQELAVSFDNIRDHRKPSDF
jgi:uncharacterized protein YegJ (DUF2314 family)